LKKAKLPGGSTAGVRVTALVASLREVYGAYTEKVRSLAAFFPEQDVSIYDMLIR
jgi:hypothetical protein